MDEEFKNKFERPQYIPIHIHQGTILQTDMHNMLTWRMSAGLGLV